LLPRRFPWRDRRLGAGLPFEGLRNEHGRSDLWLRAAGLVGLVAPLVGAAGLKGFWGADPHPVHKSDTPLDPCLACGPGTGALAPLPDVSLGGYRNASVFFSNRHAIDLWLPYFWGFSPAELWTYHHLCYRAAEAGSAAAQAGRDAEAIEKTPSPKTTPAEQD